MLYVADIDTSLSYQRVVNTYAALIHEEYRPEPDSYFVFDLPLVYEEKVQTRDYLTTLQERALYFNVEPTTDRYKVTVGLDDIWNVLENIAKSFGEYVEFNVRNILGERITDKNRIITAAKALATASRLRVCYLNLNSFHVGIAADSINLSDNLMDPAVDEFKHSVMKKFQEEVLDNNFSSIEDVTAIVEKYPDEETRRKIFDPIIKIVNNDNIKVNVNNYTKDFQKTYQRVPKNEKAIIIPPKPKVCYKTRTNNSSSIFCGR